MIHGKYQTFLVENPEEFEADLQHPPHHLGRNLPEKLVESHSDIQKSLLGDGEVKKLLSRCRPLSRGHRIVNSCQLVPRVNIPLMNI